MARMGERVQVWLRSASIRYVKPAASTLRMEFRLEDRDVAEATERLRREGRFRKSYRTEARDRNDQVCAVIDTEVYLRLPRGEEREVSAF